MWLIIKLVKKWKTYYYEIITNSIKHLLIQIQSNFLRKYWLNLNLIDKNSNINIPREERKENPPGRKDSCQQCSLPDHRNFHFPTGSWPSYFLRLWKSDRTLQECDQDFPAFQIQSAFSVWRNPGRNYSFSPRSRRIDWKDIFL